MQQRVGCGRKDENYKDLQVSTNNRLLIRNEEAKFQFCTNLFTEHGARVQAFYIIFRLDTSIYFTVLIDIWLQT